MPTSDVVWYRNGSVSITSGSKTVTGVDTLWEAQVNEGDLFTIDGTRIYEVEAVNSNTELLLRNTFAESTVSASDYAIVRNFTSTVNARLAARLADVLNRWHTREDEWYTWHNGGAEESHPDVYDRVLDDMVSQPELGMFPFTDPDGSIMWISSPAKLEEMATDHADTELASHNEDASAHANLFATEPEANKVPKADAGGTIELWLKDPLRQRVEAATGGQCTVLYDDFDLPSYMRIVPAMNATDLGLSLDSYAGLHPAFLVNGTKIPEVFIGMFQSSNIGDKAYSLPRKAPWRNIDFDASRAACVSKGTGWHLMTNWEWAAIALWCMANDFQPRGNTNHGRAHDVAHETGVRKDEDVYVPGDSDGIGNILTGTGPYSWRHDGTPAGIADLVGNVWEWNDGFKLFDGRVIMLEDNNINLCTKVTDESSWTSMNHYFSDEGSVRLQNTAGTQTDTTRNVTWKDIVKIEGYTEDDLLILGLISPNAVEPQGTFYMRSTDTRLSLRGGSRYSGSAGGLAGMSLSRARSFTFSFIGFRPAFISPDYL